MVNILSELEEHCLTYMIRRVFHRVASSPSLYLAEKLIACLLQDIKCSLYVDDFLICYPAKHMYSIEKQLNICLDRLQKWCDTNGFKVSKKKTSVYALLSIT